MKIVSASVKVIDDRNHVQFLSLADVDITIKGPKTNPIKEIPEMPEVEEVPKPKKKSVKKKK